MSGRSQKLALAGETISLLQQAEQTCVFTAKQWRMIYRVLGDNRPPENAACRGDEWNHYRTLPVVGYCCPLHSPLPVPAWLIPVTPVVKQDMTKDIAHVVMRDSEALSVLYGVWGTRSQPIRPGAIRQ